MVVLSAVAAKCASTTLWLPRLPWLQLNGTTKQVLVFLTMWWQKVIGLLAGSVMPVARHGSKHLISGSTNRLAVRNVIELLGRTRRRPATQLRRV